MEYLSLIRYRKKTLGRNKAAMEKMLMLLSIVHENRGKKYVQLPFNFLKVIFKSALTVDELLKSAVNGGVLETNNHYVPEGGVSKGYRFTQKWQNLNILVAANFRGVTADAIASQNFEGMQDIRKTKSRKGMTDDDLDRMIDDWMKEEPELFK